MLSAVANVPAGRQPGAFDNLDLAQIGVRRLEASAVVDAHRQHSRYGAGKRHKTGVGSDDARAHGNPIVDTPMPGVRADRGKVADDGAGDGSRQRGARAHGHQLRSHARGRHAQSREESQNSNERHFALPATAGSTYTNRRRWAMGTSAAIDGPTWTRKPRLPIPSAGARGVAGR
jgi:hypothetical protein